jgi:hypothetical protein
MNPADVNFIGGILRRELANLLGETGNFTREGAIENFSGLGDAPTGRSGTLSQQMSATVTILEIDANVPSVTVKTEDGRTMSFKIADRKTLEGVKVGDKVDITYTAAVMITVQ